MAHLLVLGGSGFFGKSILDAYKRGVLNEFGIDSITILARAASDLRKNFPALLSDRIALIDADLSLCDSLPHADIVIHAAATTDSARYISDPDGESKNILLCVNHFCRLALRYFRNSKILFISSGAVYGNYSDSIEYVDEDYPFNIDRQLEPSKYAYTLAKRESELIVRQLGGLGFSVSIARCFAFVGKFLPRNQHFAVGNFIQDGLNQRPIQVKASCLVYRSYMHGDDLARWLISIAIAANSNSPVFNVGSDEAISIQDLGYKLSKYFGVEANIALITSKNVDRYVPSIHKAKSQLGLILSMNLDESIKATINSIKK